MVHAGQQMNPRQVRALVLLLVLLPLFPAALVFRFLLDAGAAERAVYSGRIQSLYGKHLQTVGGYYEDLLGAEFEGFSEAVDAGAGSGELMKNFLLDGVFVFDAGGRLMDSAGWEGDGAGTGSPEAALNRMVPDAWRKWSDNPALYGRVFGLPDGTTVMGARERATLAGKALEFFQSSLGPEVRLHVATNSGELSDLLSTRRVALVSTVSLGRVLPGWTLSLELDPASALGAGIREHIKSFRVVGSWLLFLTFAISLAAGWNITRQIHLNEIRNTSLATLAHELNTPIASSRILIDTLTQSRPQSEDDRHEYLEMLAGENRRMQRVVSNFLTLARMEQSNYRLRLVPVRVAEVVESVTGSLRVRAEPVGVRVESMVEDGLSTVLADRAALDSALGNLMDNALKFSPSGGRVLLRVTRQRARLRFEVEDEGPGVPQSLAKEIFRPFCQADERVSRVGEGCGLGLSIVRRVAREHQGSAWYEPVAEGGSRFVLEIAAQVCRGEPSIRGTAPEGTRPEEA